MEPEPVPTAAPAPADHGGGRLFRALTAPGEPPVRPLPPEVSALLRTLAAPPRLAAHLRLVHDVAYELEDLLVGHLVRAAGEEPWAAFLALDEVLGRLADGADARLAFQAAHPVAA
ncbi:hypothetical protein [Streptomyces sp. NPDC058701]|uniref:hypothetical protein n=1 Tax=Streptomyces sp. NPDC058701 TaxID=3346608 RepID=UPI00365C17F0